MKILKSVANITILLLLCFNLLLTFAIFASQWGSNFVWPAWLIFWGPSLFIGWFGFYKLQANSKKELANYGKITMISIGIIVATFFWAYAGFFGWAVNQ